MVRFTETEKLQRKETIKSWNFMRTREQVLGIRPTLPPKLVFHPRHFDPPLSCRSGRHQWDTTVLMGIPILKCKKCGHIAVKGSWEGTDTKRELRTRYVPKQGEVQWK